MIDSGNMLVASYLSEYEANPYFRNLMVIVSFVFFCCGKVL